MLNRTVILSITALPILAAAPLTQAQQLNQPQPVQIPNARDASGTSPQRSTGVRSDAGQRATTPPVSPKGPATDAQRPTQPSSVTPTAPATPARVIDAQGRLVPGAVQVGNNQVLDPKTGRIYPVTPAGDGLRIATPPKP